MKHFIILVVLLALGLCALAQVPGYMGKKHFFVYTPSVSLFGNTYRVDNTKASTLFYLSHNASYNYVIKKNKVISLFYEYAGFNTYSGTESRSENQQYVYADFRKHQVGFSFRKYFRTRTLAPLGTYMKYSISALNGKSTMKEASVPYYEADYFEGIGEGEYMIETSKWDVAFGIGIGKQFVIAKYVPLNFELDVNVPWTSMFSYPTAGLEKSNLYSMIGTSLVKINVGVGILAF